MKIRMTKTVQGSLDGVTVRELVEGSEYETVDSPRGDRLAKYHIMQGLAVAAAAPTAAVPAPEPAPPVAQANARKRK